VITFEMARQENPFELAAWWVGQVSHKSPAEYTAVDHLEELARTHALAQQLTGWLPLSMHRALLAGATPGEVAVAYGADVATVHKIWLTWANGQRRLAQAGSAGGPTIGLDAAEYDQVATALEGAVR
jgi:hypothetical protein